MIPPGAFFPLADEYGLLPHLDRWVIANLMGGVKRRGRTARDGKAAGSREQELFFINISTATLCDPVFPDYVARQLYKHEFSAAMICFEIAESDVMSNRGDVDEFVRKIKLEGCKVALSGFGRARISVAVIQDLPLDFLKIDGSVTRTLLTEPISMSRLVSIDRFAKKVGIATIAELVENEDTVARLREIGVDYVQGFGVARPQPLAQIG